MSDPKDKALRKPEADAPAEGEAEASGKRSRLSWVVGWVLVPSTMLGIIFGGGVLVGVHLHDSWLARLVMWVAGLFS